MVEINRMDVVTAKVEVDLVPVYVLTRHSSLYAVTVWEMKDQKATPFWEWLPTAGIPYSLIYLPVGTVVDQSGPQVLLDQIPEGRVLESSAASGLVVTKEGSLDGILLVGTAAG